MAQTTKHAGGLHPPLRLGARRPAIGCRRAASGATVQWALNAAARQPPSRACCLVRAEPRQARDRRMSIKETRQRKRHAWCSRMCLA